MREISMGKRRVVGEKVQMVLEKWERGYRVICYCTYLSGDENCEWKEEEWDDIQSICREIEGMRWESDIEYLKRCQAKVFCRVGILYVEKGDFDCACEFLEKARSIMEELSLQYDMPEDYVLTYMYMARAYTEKRRDRARVEKYCEKAGKVLERMLKNRENEPGLPSKWPYAAARKRKVELMLQWIIIKGGAQDETKDNKKTGDSGKEEDKIRECIENVWKEIKQIEEVCAQKEKTAGVIDKWEKLWVRKQIDTYWASRGVYYKWMYFTGKKSNPVKRVGTKEKEYFEKAMESFLEGVKEDRKNTICMGNIVALLYDYHEVLQPGTDKSQCDRFLSEVLQNIESAVPEELPDEGNDDEIKAEIQKKLPVIGNYVYRFLRATLEADRNNMFALNLMAMCKRKRESEGNNENCENTKNKGTYPYLALRQSALRKCFNRMDRYLNNLIEPVSPAELKKLRNIKMDIIDLHSVVAEYMNDAVCSGELFKNLVVGHYTRACVLPKLINHEGNARLRIRNVKHLNDPSEGALFMGYVNHQMHGAARQAAYGDEKKNRAQAANDDSLIRNILQIYDYRRRDEWNQKSSVYMGCFSSRIDQLNMWSRYGEGGKGCCLCIKADGSFDEKAEVSLAGISMEEDVYRYKMEDDKYPLYMVTYLPGNTRRELDAAIEYASGRGQAEKNKLKKLQKIKEEDHNDKGTREKAAKEEKRCKEEENWWNTQVTLIKRFQRLLWELPVILNEIQKDFNGLASELAEEGADIKKEEFGKLQEEIVNTIMIIMDQVRFLVKDDAYRDEREYRVIQYSSEPQYEDDGKTIPKLYVNIEKELKYKEVYFGPLTQNYSSDSAYVLNLRKKNQGRGESEKLDVHKSDIPYCC